MNMEINYEKLEKEAPGMGIKMIILFGSRSCERERVNSDYDVAVLTTEEKNIYDSLKNYSKVLDLLCRAFGIKEDRVDLTNLNRANPLLRYDIFLEGKLIFGSTNEFEEFKAFSFRDYIDAKPLFNLESDLIKKRLQLIKNSI